MPDHKPAGYNAVSPYLVVNDARATIAFLQRAFDATPLRLYEREDGSIMHAEIRLDDTVVMLSDPDAGWPAYAAHLHFYLPDVDAAYQRALDAGGTAVQEPRSQEGDPDRRGGVKDPSGNTWWISTQQAAT